MKMRAVIFKEGEDFGDDRVVIEVGAVKWPERILLTLQNTHEVIGYAENFERTATGEILADITVTTDDAIDPNRVVSWVHNTIAFKKDEMTHVSYGDLRQIKAPLKTEVQ